MAFGVQTVGPDPEPVDPVPERVSTGEVEGTSPSVVEDEATEPDPGTPESQ